MTETDRWRTYPPATHQVQRGAYRGSSGQLPDWLREGTLLRLETLRREGGVHPSGQCWELCSVGIYTVIGGPHAGERLALVHSCIESDPRDPRPLVEEHPDLERLD